MSLKLMLINRIYNLQALDSPEPDVLTTFSRRRCRLNILLEAKAAFRRQFTFRETMINAMPHE